MMHSPAAQSRMGGSLSATLATVPSLKPYAPL
eukprot:jgi/Chlat1/1517/Chrsp120S01798